MLRLEIDLYPSDEHPFDLGARFQRIAIGEDQIGPLRLFDRTDLAGNAPDFRGIDRDRL